MLFPASTWAPRQRLRVYGMSFESLSSFFSGVNMCELFPYMFLPEKSFWSSRFRVCASSFICNVVMLEEIIILTIIIPFR